MIFVHPLTDDERQTLRKLERQAVGRVAKRARIILWSDQGRSVPEIASLLDLSKPTVRMWIQRYEAHGILGLYDEPRSGRPRQADDKLNTQLGHLMETSPNQLGHLATVWTAVLLAVHLAGLGWQVSCSTVHRALHTLDYRWSRPRLAGGE